MIAALARRLGAPGDWTPDPERVFGELRRASAGGPADYAGISYERIAAEDGVFWPCPAPDHPGTPRMFLDRFATPDGRARFVPVEHRPGAEDLDAEYPVYLTTGRVLQHYQSGAQTRRVPALRAAQPEPFVEIHPDLAAGLLARRRETGSAWSAAAARRRAASRITDTIRADTVFMPFHWGGAGSANLVTNPALDPVSKMPEFKVCAVRLEAVTVTGRDRLRVVVVGNGMAGVRFVQELLAAGDPDCAVTVVGDEPGGAYNRVLLPHVLAGAAREDSIALAGEGWYDRHAESRCSPAVARRADRPGRNGCLSWPTAAPSRTTCSCSRPAAAPVLPPRRRAGTATDGELPRGAGRVPHAGGLRPRSGRSPTAPGSAVVLGGGVLGLETARGLAGGRPAGHAGAARAAADGPPARRGRGRACSPRTARAARRGRASRERRWRG